MSLGGDGTIDYLPPLNFNGADSFNYTLQDSFGITVNGTVNITVDSVNDVPIANDDTFDEVLKDTLTILPVLLNDNDVESSSLTVFSVNTTGTLGSVVCPLGYYQRSQFAPLEITPAATNLNELFFQPNGVPWQPQQSNPRQLIRIGNTYRNGA